MTSNLRRRAKTTPEINGSNFATPWLGVADREIRARDNFGLLAILNLTLDSFFDGGRFRSREEGVEAAKSLLDAGADVIDIGCESTRPGAKSVDAVKEREEVSRAIRLLRSERPEAQISADTRKAAVAAAALENGAAIINDVSSFDYDPGMLDVLVQYKPAYVLTHNRGPADAKSDDKPDEITARIKRFFDAKLNALARAGFPENRVALDPGVGFGKSPRENLAVMTAGYQFAEFGRPLLAAVSMKSVFGFFPGLPLTRRKHASLVAAVILWQKGFFWHRVHHVCETRDALLLADALGVGESNVCRSISFNSPGPDRFRNADRAFRF